MFLSSLGPVMMRWFDGLQEGSINSFKDLTRVFEARFVTCSTRVFEARFVTCSRVSRPLNSLLSMTIQEGETLKTYSDRY